MKKPFFYAMLCVVVAITVIINFLPVSGVFSLDDYSSQIQQFPGDQSFGPVCSSYQAISVAKTVWNELYPNGSYGIPYRVFYDNSNHAWMVQASICFILPSGPYILLSEKDGMVLAVWNEKF